uniref:Uncharacterized protein n=1 Tax=Panagrolaimus superbus TaxID=310955 RepID=A0A914XVU6_9BILA
MAYSDFDERYEICAFPLNQNAHRYDLTLMIDENNMPKYNISRIETQNIINLPQKFDETITTKIPVISFFDNSSVICVHKNAEKNGYQFLESWNGKYGNELYIAFDKEELAYCTEAIKIYQTKPSFVICDLLKIMSMPLKEVLSIKTLSFSITKDSKNDILLEFDNFDGTRKIASPAFLMALLLEQHLKAIKAEINETPKELYFCFPYDRDIENRKRIVKWIQESCKLAKINCNFVDA